MNPVLVLLLGLTAARRLKDPITSDKLLPSVSNMNAFYPSVSDTSGASDSVATLGFISAPTGTQGSHSSLNVSDLTFQAIGSKYAGVDPSYFASIGYNDTAGYNSGAYNFSFTAQTIVDNMDLTECVQQVQFANQQYTAFSNAITGLSTQVKQAQEQLSGIDIVTHNILVEEENFVSELERMNVLYNTLAVRLNALGKWMSDERGIRMNLEELYRQMVSKNSDEEQRLDSLRADVTQAMSRLADVQSQTSTVLSDVANAQIAMYDWAVNVTDAVNNQTTKINSVVQDVQYRITQIETIIPEMRNMAKKTQYIAQSLGETNLAYAAANVLNHIQSTMNSVSVSDTIMTIPATPSTG